MNFEAKLAGFVYRDGTNGEGWPDCVIVDNGGILLSEYDTRTYYPIDRRALLALADELEIPMRDGGYSKRIAHRIQEALGVQDG